MNVYDFDKTIYNGDSTVDFYKYVLKKHPSLLRFVPKQAFGFVLYALKLIDKTTLKSYFFSFLQGIDTNASVTSFWNENHNKIYTWYEQKQKPDDIIISASPEFLLTPICKRLGIKHLIATVTDEKNGQIIGLNCKGEEKVKRFTESFGNIKIQQFYSDSLSDLPLAKLAEEAFLVVNGEITVWEVL